MNHNGIGRWGVTTDVPLERDATKKHAKHEAEACRRRVLCSFVFLAGMAFFQRGTHEKSIHFFSFFMKLQTCTISKYIYIFIDQNTKLKIIIVHEEAFSFLHPISYSPLHGQLPTLSHHDILQK